MKKLAILAALAATTAFVPAADAAILQYEVFGAPTTANAYAFKFNLDTSVAASFVSGSTGRFFPLSVQVTLPGAATPVTVTTGANFSFPTQISGTPGLEQPFFTVTLINGLPITRFDLYNTFLTAGNPNAPVFLTGTFALSTTPRNGGPRPADDYVVRVTNLAGAVPEPASWALMIGGFGVVGASMRRRARTSVRFA